jgi:hypothetical protein
MQRTGKEQVGKVSSRLFGENGGEECCKMKRFRKHYKEIVEDMKTEV